MSLAVDGAATSIVGIGATQYFKRGESLPRSGTELACDAILAAVTDAGLSVKDIDGFSYFGGGGTGVESPIDPGLLMETLGIPEISFAAGVAVAGGGSAGAVGLASIAVSSGTALYVAVVFVLQQHAVRLGQIFANKLATAENSFIHPGGFFSPGQFLATQVRRHMHLYGTSREAFAEVAVSTRSNAINRPKARMRKPLTREEYFASRMVAEPLCLFDFCLETDGAVAVIVSTTERGRDLRQRPIKILNSPMGGRREWGRGFLYGNMPDHVFASAGFASLAPALFANTGLTVRDVDVALLYDHFAPLVVMQLEDLGFCNRGEGGPFVESGAIRFPGGTIPVNTHGGHLSEAYLVGMTHILEAVEQLRGTATNQVEDAEIAVVTGGPAPLPLSALLLARG